MTTAIEVAELESEVKQLREVMARAEIKLAVLTAERDALKIEAALAQHAARTELIRSTTMESIMTQVSAGLIDGLNKMNAERNAERAVRRQKQEHALEVDAEGSPSFLQRRGAKSEDPIAQPSEERVEVAEGSVHYRQERVLTRFAAMQPRTPEQVQPSGYAEGGMGRLAPNDRFNQDLASRERPAPVVTGKVNREISHPLLPDQAGLMHPVEAKEIDDGMARIAADLRSDRRG